MIYEMQILSRKGLAMELVRTLPSFLQIKMPSLDEKIQAAIQATKDFAEGRTPKEDWGKPKIVRAREPKKPKYVKKIWKRLREFTQEVNERIARAKGKFLSVL